MALAYALAGRILNISTVAGVFVFVSAVMLATLYR
jgi:hypothetical protein